jgi:hypothetical protein
MNIKVPNSEILRLSAISHLRDVNANEEADLLSKCKIEISSGQRYSNTSRIGLNITLRCMAIDLGRFKESDSGWELSSQTFNLIKNAVESILPIEFTVHEMSARSFLVERSEFEKTELERLIEAQKDLMIAVATGGPRIDSKNQDYKERRDLIRRKLDDIGKRDPNHFEDLWAWYSRWRGGDLPSYQSRREYVRKLYQPLFENLAGVDRLNPAEPIHEPTGWEKVDRVVDEIIAHLARANREEEYQTVGLLCRECFISLAQAVYNSELHQTKDGVKPSDTDAYRMLEAYFSAEYSGSQNEALRRHVKASLNLANELQHKRTADYKDAALCSEATRTVVNIVVITSGKR